MHIKVAAPYKRLLAFLIDILLLIPLITVGIFLLNQFLHLPVTPELTERGFEIKMDDWAKEHFWQVVFLYSSVKAVILALYFIPLESSKWQGTLGKKWMKIRVTDTEGQPISLTTSVIRFLSKILSAQLLVGYIMILFTANKQGLHDLIAKTVVQEA